MDSSEDSWESSPVSTHAFTSLSRAVRGFAGISVSSLRKVHQGDLACKSAECSIARSQASTLASAVLSQEP